VKTDKASGIVNDPNDWSRETGDPRYILDLLARIVTVSLETIKVVNSLPPLEIRHDGPLPDSCTTSKSFTVRACLIRALSTGQSRWSGGSRGQHPQGTGAAPGPR
jgi:hypothetical protein